MTKQITNNFYWKVDEVRSIMNINTKIFQHNKEPFEIIIDRTLNGYLLDIRSLDLRKPLKIVQIAVGRNENKIYKCSKAFTSKEISDMLDKLIRHLTVNKKIEEDKHKEDSDRFQQINKELMYS